MKNIYTMIAVAALGVVSTAASAQSQKPTTIGGKTNMFVSERSPAAQRSAARPNAIDAQRGGIVNDECSGAIALTVGAECTGTPASLTGATQSMASSTCSGYTAAQANDVWFSFVAGTQPLVLQVQATEDVVLEVLSGACASLASVICVDAGSAGETLMLSSLQAGTYYARVYAYSADVTTPDFTICVFNAPPAPANDQCSGVTPVALNAGTPVTFTGTTVGATEDGDFAETSPLFGQGMAVVWHAFTTTECTRVSVSYCNTDPAFETVLARLTTACPGDAVIVRDGINWSCTNGGAEFYYNNLPAGTYYFPVLNDLDIANGPYSIQLSAEACPEGYCIPMPATGTAEGDYVSNVELNTLANATGGTDAYQDYTAMSTILERGGTYTIHITNGEYAPNMEAAWIDYNQNEAFEAGEKLGEFETTEVGEAAAITFTVPMDAGLGTTRLRVRGVYLFGGGVEACPDYTFGETEDYSVEISAFTNVNDLGANAFSVFPNPTNGDITISGASLSGTVLFELTDMTGRIVYSERRGMVAKENVVLPIAGKVAAGTYNLSLMTTQGRSVRTVVVR